MNEDARARMEHYRTPERADAYRRKWTGSASRRIASWREISLVRRMLGRFPKLGPVLDCPCGAGRLLPQLKHLASEVIAADLSLEMAKQARPMGSSNTSFAVASAMALPFREAAFDVAVCHRLLHHFPDPNPRAAILAELRRVSRRGVVLTFWDAKTLRGRRMRGSRRSAITADQLAEESASVGLALELPILRVGGLFSAQAVACLRNRRARD